MKIIVIKKAYKDHGPCHACGKEIEKGDTYKWFKHRWGSPRKFCPDCRIKRSMLANSDKLGRLYEIQERFECCPESIQELSEMLDQAAADAREIAEEYGTSAARVAQYFEESDTEGEIQDRADTVHVWADILEAAVATVVGMDEFESALSYVRGEVETLEL